MWPDDRGDAGLVVGVVAEDADARRAVLGQKEQTGLQGHQRLGAGVGHVVAQCHPREKRRGIVDLINSELHPESPYQPICK